MSEATKSGVPGAGGQISAQLAEEFRNLLDAVVRRLVAGVGTRVESTAERLTGYAGGAGGAAVAAGARRLAEGKSPLQAMVGAGLAGGKEKLKQMTGGTGAGGGRRGGKLKVTNIVEAIDVGVPARVAYNQWTQFEDFPSFMKKVEHIEQEADERLTWKAQVFWSHRTWESTIVEQIPDKRIIWRSTGEKGSVDGAVTFHELAPELTRIVLVLEYHPQGLFEHTGNIWRAQGRRVRLELKHFVRHVMTQTILHADEVQGWRGEIHDGRVVKDHESALAEEKRRAGPPQPRREAGERRRPAERPRRPVRRAEEPAGRPAVRRTRAAGEE